MSVGGDPIRVLHVDDDPDICEIARLHLERAHDEIEVVTETSADDALDCLTDADIDCVVSDYDMPGTDGLELLEAVRDRYENLPFILFTGKGSEEIASDAISAGVTEYLQKEAGTEQYTVLANRIERAVSEQRAKSALEESERMLSTLIANLPGMVYRCRNERGWPMDFVSDGARELTGYDPAALERGEVRWGEEVLLEEERDDLWEAVQTALDADEPFEVTYRIRTKEGEQRWAWEQGRVVDTTGDDTEIIEGFIIDITARKEREKELAAEQEFTESILNAIDDLVYVMDDQGQIVRWNDRLNEVTGYSDAEITAMSGLDFFPDSFEEKARESFERILETGSDVIETELVTKSGERIPYEFRSSLMDIEDEGPLVGGVGRDISERKAREQQLEQYEMLVENVGDPMYIVDTERTIQMANEPMAETLGYDREEIVGTNAAEFIADEDARRSDELIVDLLKDDDRSWETMEMRVVHSDGTETIAETKLAVLTDENGEYTGTVGVVRDISERKARERELARYETIIQAVGDPVYTLDEEGTFTFVNEAIKPMTGYAPEELIGENISTVIGDGDLTAGQDLIRELLDSPEENVTVEMAFVTKTGESVPIENHMALLPDDDGGFRGIAGVVRDIETRKRREERLEQFASVVSHDLRSPLNVVQGRARLVEQTGDTDHIQDVIDAAGRMERLIEELLTLAQQGQTVGETEHVEIEPLAERAWRSIDAGEASLLVASSCGVQADPERLREAIENLFRNSVEHGATDADHVTIRVGSLDDRVGFYVEDDGPGIPESKRERVFERGFTDADGTGFGLAIVENVARAHGWEIELTDNEDGGARFEFVVD